MEKYLLSSGDIVFARTGASVGKTYIYKENDGIVYFAGFLIRAKVTQENDAEFVFQNTLTSNYEKYIRITSQRSGQPGVNAQEYGEYEFLAPSKEEQAKIGKYLRELEIGKGKKAVASNEVQTSKDTKTYKVGNDTVIQPKEYKENTGISTVINILIGLVLGAALIWFVVVPARSSLIKNEADTEIKQYSEQVAVKNSEIEDLKTDLTDLETKNKDLQKQIDGYEGDSGVLTAYDNLLKASALYIDGKSKDAASVISDIPARVVNEAKPGFQTMYEKINGEVMTKAAKEFYETGYTAYSAGNYEVAVENLKKAYDMNQTDVNAVYYLARSYEKQGDNANALTYFKEVTEKFPGTRCADDAAIKLEKLSETTEEAQ